MFNIFILRSSAKPFMIWRNPNTAAIANNDNRWTPRQLYLDAKGERAQRKVLQMAVRSCDGGFEFFGRTTICRPAAQRVAIGPEQG